MSDDTTCPDCGLEPLERWNGQSPQKMLETACPNRRHDAFRQIHDIAAPVGWPGSP